MLLSEELFSSHEKAVAMPSVVYHYCSMASFLSILKQILCAYLILLNQMIQQKSPT